MNYIEHNKLCVETLINAESLIATYKDLDRKLLASRLAEHARQQNTKYRFHVLCTDEAVILEGLLKLEAK